MILLYGIASLCIITALVMFWQASVLKKNGCHVPTFKDDVASLIDENIHKLLMTPHAVSADFTILPLLYMMSMAFTNYSKEGDHLVLFDWGGMLTFIVLAAVTLYCYRRYEEKSLQNVLIKGIVTAAAFAWGVMLNVQDSFAVILLVCVLWGFPQNPLYRNFAGAAAVVACTLVSPYYLASPMGFLAIHFYNKEPGEGSRIAGDLAYPVILLLFGVAAKFL